VSELVELLTRETPERDPVALEGLRRRMVADFVLCTPFRLEREAMGVGGILAPVMYTITGSRNDRDRLFIGEVIDKGPGVRVAGQWETIAVDRGDVFLCNLHNISYRLPERGRQVYQVRNGVIYATLDKETFEVRPVQDLILVRKNEERALRHQSGGPIWLPTEAISTDDVRSHAIVLEYGEVVAQGPGRWKDGQWLAPPCKVGDLILFDASYSTLPVTIKGESFTLVPSQQVAQIADEA
jgi:co-chaperonin GroES (HSP10)